MELEYTNVSDAYKATLKSIGLFSEKFLKFIPRAIPDYPSHGVDHSKEILALLDQFIEVWQVNLAEKEIYLLYLGAWVHDIGNITGREGHNEKSAKIIDKIPFFGSILGRDIITLLKWVVKAHSSTYPLERVPKDCLGVRLQLICSIFRIVDACEIVYSKCPSEVYEIIKDDLDAESDKYWKAHMSIIGVSFKIPKIKIVVDDPKVSNILVDHLKKEIDSTKGVLASNGIPVPCVEVAVADDADLDYVTIDFRTIFPDVFEKCPSEITSVIEGELSKLVNEEILSESPTDVYAVERKTVNLFHSFFNTIIEHHRICPIHLYKTSPIVRIKRCAPTNVKESILLIDGIGHRGEVSTICATLNDLNIPIYKVCGYVAKKESIDELQKQFPQITFKFIHDAEDDKTYDKFLWRLMPVYQSRLEPLESEHPFYRYRFTSKIGEDIVNDIIVRACSELFGENFSVQDGSMRINEDSDRRSDDIVGWTVEYNSLDSIMEKIISKEQEMFFQIERLLLRFVFDTSKSRLRAMVFCSPVDVDLNRFRNNEVCCRNFLSRRYCDTFEKDIAHEVTCPLCIDTNMSIKILDEFEDKLQLITEEAGYKVINVGRYDPFKNI